MTRAAAALFALTALGTIADAQDAQPTGANAAPSAMPLSTLPAVPAPNTNGTNTILSPSAEPGLAEVPPLLQWQDLSVRPRASYRYLYGNGLQAQAGHQENTSVQTLAAGVLMTLGTHWSLDYSPTWTFYSNSAFRDTVSHAVSLSGRTEVGDWNLGLSQTYATGSPTLVETGAQTKQETYATSVDASYRLGPRTMIDLGASQSVRLSTGFTNTREWSSQDSLHYAVTEGMDTALVVGAGYVDVTPGPNMQYVQPQVQMSVQATPKLALTLRGGMEHRTFNTSRARSLNNPIMSASVEYAPEEATHLSLGVSRSVSASYFSNEVIRSTGWNAGFDQRLLGVLHLSAGYGHQEASYLSPVAGVATSRRDRYDSFNVRLGTAFLKRGSAGVLYQFSRNGSNSSGYGFNSHQIGFDISYQF